MLVCICLPVYTTFKPRTTLSSSKMWAECNMSGAFALEFVNAKFWCALLRRFGYLFCLFLTINKMGCLLAGSLTVADIIFYFDLALLESHSVRFVWQDTTCVLSIPGLTNLWHAYPKWQARSFSWHAAFTAAPISFHTNLAISWRIYRPVFSS
jgi:hypothetical protein